MNRLFLFGLIFAVATLAHTQTASGPIYQMVDLHRLSDQTFASPAYLVGQFIYMGEFQGKQMFRNFTVLPGPRSHRRLLTSSTTASFPVTIHVANRSRANACVRSHSPTEMPSPPQSPRSAFMSSRLMYAHCSHSTILRARVVLPENESPHIRYNVLMLRVYFGRTTASSTTAHAGVY